MADDDHVSIAEATCGKFRSELDALGVRIVLTPFSDGVRRWLLCPNPECKQYCTVLYHIRGRVVCERCAKALKNLQQKPEAIVQLKAGVRQHANWNAYRSEAGRDYAPGQGAIAGAIASNETGKAAARAGRELPTTSRRPLPRPFWATGVRRCSVCMRLSLRDLPHRHAHV